MSQFPIAGGRPKVQAHYAAYRALHRQVFVSKLALDSHAKKFALNCIPAIVAAHFTKDELVAIIESAAEVVEIEQDLAFHLAT